MKRIICLLLFAAYGLLANPIVPGLDISELKFDSQNNWQLEIRKFNSPGYPTIDSLVITTNTGSSKIKSSAFSSDSLYFVVENSTACLTKPLEINASGDFIQLTTYYIYQPGQSQTTTLGFGSNSAFADLRPNQSIALIEGINYGFHGYAIDNTPNLGSINREDGAVGQLKGLLLDKNGNPLPNAQFDGPGFWANTNSTGHYTINLLAKRHYISHLSLQSPYYSNVMYEPSIIIPIQPDSVKNFNFSLISSGVDNNSANVKSSALLYNYPNPFNNQTAIYYEVPEGVKYKNAAIRISNIKGEAVAVLAAKQKSGSVYWNADHNSAGMYIYQLLIDGKAVKSGEMVLLK